MKLNIFIKNTIKFTKKCDLVTLSMIMVSIIIITFYIYAALCTEIIQTNPPSVNLLLLSLFIMSIGIITSMIGIILSEN